MEEGILFSIIMYLDKVNPVFFRDCLESISASTYKEFELIIVDGSGMGSNGSAAEEFFPGEERLKFYRIRPGRTIGYGLNLAASYATGDYVLVMDNHCRLNPMALQEIAKLIEEKEPTLIYTDNDELVGNDRMNPDFKSGPNLELLRHKNYIGNVYALKRETLRRIGNYRDVLGLSAHYDLLLRLFENRLKIAHIPRLLYSKRIFHQENSQRETDARLSKIMTEQMTVAAAHLKRRGIQADIKPHKSGDFWNISYNGSGYKSNRGDYMLVREAGIRIPGFKNAVSKMYGHMKQQDVGIVGVAYTKGFFSYENCGYIFDTSGIAYPACHGQSTFLDGYANRCIIPQEVSAVDFGFCMIKKKLFRRLKGFDTTLVGRDIMLDFCLRARQAGYRIVFEPGIRVSRRTSTHESNAGSNEILMQKHGETIKSGDPYYNRNLPMGLENYFLY